MNASILSTGNWGGGMSLRRHFIVALRIFLATLALVAAAFLTYKAFSASIERGQEALARIVMAICGLAAGLVAFAGSEKLSFPQSAKLWLENHSELKLIGAAFAAAYAMFGAAQMFAPQTAVEARPGSMQKDLADIKRNTTPQRAARPVILQHIDGLWGEPGCKVVFRIRLEGGDRTVAMQSVTEPAGYPHWSSSARIEQKNDLQILTVVSDLADPARGQATYFTYKIGGPVEQLLWQPAQSETPTVLQRCP